MSVTTFLCALDAPRARAILGALPADAATPACILTASTTACLRFPDGGHLHVFAVCQRARAAARRTDIPRVVSAPRSLRPPQTDRPPFDGDEAARLYRSGWTLRQVGKRFGISQPTVRTRLAQLGVEIRPRGWKGHIAEAVA